MKSNWHEQYIIVVGNVLDGLGFIGPFDDYDSALSYGEKLPPIDEWHVTQLEIPLPQNEKT